MWYGWGDGENGPAGPWGAWAYAYSHADSRYDHIEHSFFISIYIVTGIITGGIAGFGPMERSRRWIRFLCGPGLICLFWMFDPLDAQNTILPVLICFCVAATTFRVSGLGFGRMFTPKLRELTVGSNLEREDEWPPPPQVR